MKGKNHQAYLFYLFDYNRPSGPVIYRIQHGVSREGSEVMFEGFEWIFQTDGYSAFWIKPRATPFTPAIPKCVDHGQTLNQDHQDWGDVWTIATDQAGKTMSAESNVPIRLTREQFI